jgi:hypothetical protein
MNQWLETELKNTVMHSLRGQNYSCENGERCTDLAMPLALATIFFQCVNRRDVPRVLRNHASGEKASDESYVFMETDRDLSYPFCGFCSQNFCSEVETLRQLF